MTDKPLYIYLDQNKWIDLARAYHNRPDGSQYKKVLQKIVSVVEDKKAVFPLSAFHFAETQKNKNPPRRQRLAKVMARISQGSAIFIHEDVTKTEIQIACAKIFGYTPPLPPNVFGRGMSFALGIDLRSLSANVSDDPLAKSDGFAQLLETVASTTQMTELFLSGKVIQEHKLMEAKKKYEENLSNVAKETEQFRAQLKPHLQTEADHRRLYVVNLQIVLSETIETALKAYGKTLDDLILVEENEFAKFVEDVPTLDVQTELIVRRNANWGKVVDKNDLADISALTIAIPYCDIVVTEVVWKDLALRSGINKKYNTKLISDVSELADYL